MTALTRTYSLPFGFRATFCWRDANLQVDWKPHFPHIKKQRAFKRFLAAYQSARRDFFQDIAATIGGNIMVVDTDKDFSAEVIAAPSKH